MPSGSSIQSKISKTLERLNATSRLVYLRSVSSSGGNSLLGLGQSVSSSDTLAEPQPAVDLMTTHEIAVSGNFFQMGDYKMIFAGTIEESTWQTNLIVYGEEVLKIVRYDPQTIYGTVAAWEVVARAVKP
jgi:hypothetical protein